MAAGLPGWTGLLAPLARSIGCSVDLDPLKIAQVYEFRRDRNELIEHVLKQTDSAGRMPTDNHRSLAHLGIKTWITTNYDNLIEKTFEQLNRPFHKIVSDKDLPFMGSNSYAVIKFHGDREHKDTITLTRQDFFEHRRKYPNLTNRVSLLLLEKTFLFIGYGLNDPDFIQIHAEIAFDVKNLQRTAYAVLFDLDEVSRDDLKARRIHAINIETHGKNHTDSLSEFLKELWGQTVLKSSIPRKIYTGSDAEKRVNNDIRLEFSRNGFKLLECVEYLIYFRMTDEGQHAWQHPQWTPPEEAEAPQGYLIKKYERTEKGNIWLGFAKGEKVKSV